MNGSNEGWVLTEFFLIPRLSCPGYHIFDWILWLRVLHQGAFYTILLLVPQQKFSTNWVHCDSSVSLVCSPNTEVSIYSLSIPARYVYPWIIGTRIFSEPLYRLSKDFFLILQLQRMSWTLNGYPNIPFFN